MKVDDEIYLRRNIVDGAYQDIDHYTDVIFRLTREDFMRPLREGVQNHVTEKQGRVTEVHYYKKVTIGPPDASRCGIVWTVYFDAGKRNWDRSKLRFFSSNISSSL